MLSVALGAFGAHGLEGKVSEQMLTIWEKGVTYQMYHAIGLFIVALLIDKLPTSQTIAPAGWFFFAGIVFFSGSLYLLSVTGVTKLGMITPIGGLCFIIGWVLLAISAIRGIA